MPAGGTARGEVLYATCLPCHGEKGEGRPELSAPAIAGLPQWYVKAQVNKFRTGARGAHALDAEGLRMRPMAQAMTTDLDVDSVSEFVARQPPLPFKSSLQDANAEAGRRLYTTCAACHGPTGTGNELMGAPPLNTQPDWYLVKQLGKFKHGIRGAGPGDVSGATMRPMAMMLADDAAINNVVAFISTFPR